MATYYHDDWNIDEEDDELEVEEKICYWDKSFIKGANLIILSKVWKYMKAGNVDGFYELLGISEKTARNLIRGYSEEKKQYMINGVITTRKIRFPGDRWDYKAIAEKLGLDYRIFSGERLLQINGNMTKKIKRIYEDELYKALKSGKISKAEYNEYIGHESEYTTEKKIWKYIIIFRNKDKQIKELQKVMLNNLKQQVINKKFNDEQLNKFCSYVDKNMRN